MIHLFAINSIYCTLYYKMHNLLQIPFTFDNNFDSMLIFLFIVLLDLTFAMFTFVYRHFLKILREKFPCLHL